ncbi:hypothetical protein Patl1_30476 [Pistacia atlantica]|uniref:Uncharacterized protein n=1 Tax=Pistacia atlantica TaxID=434234 RepID=A0ACC1AB88_9ROSI|nr:hypothetical protein Patl1_30476 [Pistacia atlantica]
MVKLINVAFLLALFVSTARAQTIFDVAKDGAKANGPDINPALTSTWKKACASPSPSKVLIPKGTFSLSPVTLEGPCKAAIEVQVQGTLKAQSGVGKTTEDGGWVTFQHIEGFTLSGGGIFDGQGGSSWGSCGNDYCKQLPIVARTLASVALPSPRLLTAKTTDGIHIGRSSGIEITDSKIGTGDDCISIGGGSQNISITKVACGPGHGISVGSTAMPVAPHLTCISRTLTLVNVSNPIIIDQAYCPHDDYNAKLSSKLKISNLSFKNIRGTSATPVAVKLACSSGVPCEGVELAIIDLKYIGKEGPITSECINVKPMMTGVQGALACGGTTGAAPARKA